MGNAGQSRRQSLLEYAETGRLRNALERAHPTPEDGVIDLIVDICLRYTTPRRRKELK